MHKHNHLIHILAHTATATVVPVHCAKMLNYPQHPEAQSIRSAIRYRNLSATSLHETVIFRATHFLQETSINCHRRTCATHCITTNVLQRWTLSVINLRPNYIDNASNSWCFRVIASYPPKVANFNLPHLHLVPPAEWHWLSFAEIFGTRKLQSMVYRVALFAWS